MHWRRKWHPLQCSCLENPRDGGACWAAVYGVAKSRIRLKRLSSSSPFIRSANFLKLTPPCAGKHLGTGSFTALVGIQNGTAALEKSFINMTHNPTILFLGIYPSEMKTSVHTKTIHMNLYTGFTHNCQDLETTQKTFN